MKQAIITTAPTQTAKGPVHDFQEAALKEVEHISLNTLYWFGKTAVRFHVRAGKTGATFYRPHKFGFEITKVTTGGVRKHEGWIEANQLLRL